MVAEEKYIWECSKGHQWIATWDSVRRVCWCPVCARDKQKADQTGKKKGLLSENLTGKRYGKWLVLHEITDRKVGALIYWMCQCACGETIKPASGNSLKAKTSTGCGCSARKLYCEKHNMARLLRPSQKGRTRGSSYCPKCVREDHEKHYKKKIETDVKCIICGDLFGTFLPKRAVVCPEKIKPECREKYQAQQMMLRRKENPEKYRDASLRYSKEFYAKNPETAKARTNKYRKNPKNKDKIRKWKAIDKKRSIDNLSDRYIRELLATHSIILKGGDIPQGLIEIKRLQLTLKREARRAYGNKNKD